MLEIISEDLDAMPVSDLYNRTYTGKEEQEAAISETEAAISEQHDRSSQHVTYAGRLACLLMTGQCH